MMKEFGQATKTFAKKAQTVEGHDPIFAQVKGNNDKWGLHFEMGCSCGWFTKQFYDKNKRATHRTGQNGDILTQQYR